jgi:hypothetical protein
MRIKNHKRIMVIRARQHHSEPEGCGWAAAGAPKKKPAHGRLKLLLEAFLFKKRYPATTSPHTVEHGVRILIWHKAVVDVHQVTLLAAEIAGRRPYIPSSRSILPTS